MRGIVFGVALLSLLGPTVSADDTTNVWDRTYGHDDGTSSWPCPGALSDVIVKDGKFTIPWEVKIRDRPVAIGKIVGTVRPSGLATAKVVLLDPLPPAFVKAMEEDHDSIDELRQAPVKIKFESFHDGREVRVSFERWSCSTSWKEDREALTAAAEGGTVSCKAGPNAAALWSAKRSYGVGELARVNVAGQPVRLYRCVDGCKAGEDPLTRQEVHEVQAWAFVGACAGEKSPDTPLPAKGAKKWDATYQRGTFYTSDWRCPADKELKDIVVKNGRFSVPWYLKTDLADGQKYEDMQIGHIDAAIADDGKVTFRYVWTVDKLPPEVLDAVKYDKGHATLEYINTLTAAMTFVSDSGKMNPSGQGVKAKLTFNEDTTCYYDYLGAGYKQQEFKESDGWRVECDSYEEWGSGAVYKDGDQAVTGGGLYRCTESSHCKRGARPGRSPQWKRVGRCK